MFFLKFLLTSVKNFALKFFDLIFHELSHEKQNLKNAQFFLSGGKLSRRILAVKSSSEHTRINRLNI